MVIGAVSLHLGVISNNLQQVPREQLVQSPFIWESSLTAGSVVAGAPVVQSPFIWESSLTRPKKSTQNASGAVSLHLGVISNLLGAVTLRCTGAVSLHLGVISNTNYRGENTKLGAVSLHLGVISNPPKTQPPRRKVQSPFIWESSPTIEIRYGCEFGCSLPSFGSHLQRGRCWTSRMRRCSLPSFGSHLQRQLEGLRSQHGCSLPSFGSHLQLNAITP